MRLIEHQNFDEERALYGSRGVIAKNCIFDGSADGESAFKECSDISVEDCLFNLRYPFWHNHGLNIHHSEMTELCRAAILGDAVGAGGQEHSELWNNACRLLLRRHSMCTQFDSG